MVATLDQELQTFEKLLPELLQHNEGQFALVHGDRLLGTFTTFQEAFEAGVRQVGLQPFLVKPIAREQGVVQFPALAVGVISARL